MDTKQDFEQIVLLSKELELLKEFEKGDHLKKPYKELRALSEYHLIAADIGEIDPNSLYMEFSGTHSISDRGQRYLAYLEARQIEKRKNYIASKWIDFLALIVAITALIVSIIALRH